MAGNPRSTQEYYDSIDRKDPRKAVVIPRVDDEEISRFGTMILAFLSIILVLLTLPFSLCYCVKVVQEYERAVIFRLGRLKKGGASGPGLFFILPCIDKYSCVDLRTVSYEVPPQEMLSRDSVTVSVDAVCFYKVRGNIILHITFLAYFIHILTSPIPDSHKKYNNNAKNHFIFWGNKHYRCPIP